MKTVLHQVPYEELMQALNQCMRKHMQPPFQTNTDYAHDLFISYASENKEEFARPLVEALESRGPTGMVR